MVNECTGSHRVCSCHAWTPTIVGAYTKAPDRGDIPQHVSQEEDTVWGGCRLAQSGAKCGVLAPATRFAHDSNKDRTNVTEGVRRLC